MKPALEAVPDDVGAESTDQDYALVGAESEITLFPRDDFKVEQSEATLDRISVAVSGQFKVGDEFEIRVPVKCVNVIVDGRDKTRRHILHGTELHRLNGVESGE